MKNWNNILLATATLGILWSCGNSTPADETEVEGNKEPACFYKYNSGSSKMEWTSFKFNDKAPVKGTFTEMVVTGTLQSDDPVALLKSLNFTIDVNSVETQNSDRNGKIVEHFFLTLETDALTGKMLEMNEDGTAVIEVNMHNMTGKVPGTYTWENNVFTYKGTMDVTNWDGMAGINALNEVCKDLHTGEDGVSKLWPTVDLMFSTTLSSDCD